MWTIGIWTTQFENVFGQSKAYASLIGSGLNATNYVAGKIFQEVSSDYLVKVAFSRKNSLSFSKSNFMLNVLKD